MAVYFHGSFGLKREILSRLVALGLGHSDWRDRELAAEFGYGKPFGAKYRSWLHKTGLAEMGFPLRLTPMGSVVFENDPKLESRTSLWFLHHELTQDPERAEAWHYFAKIFLPRHASFTRGDLLEGLTDQLRSHSEKHFGPGSKLNKVIAAKLLECYTQDAALGPLGLVQVGDKRYIRGSVNSLEGPWRSPEELRRSFRR